MEYGDILVYIENLIESIEYEEISLLELRTKLQELAIDIEESIETSDTYDDDFDFGDLD
jgi:hypothetical protein